jgi:hypothetical protein
MFISKKKWNMIVSDIYELQDDLFILELYVKRLIDKDNKENAQDRHPASKNNRTNKKVEKNGK